VCEVVCCMDLYTTWPVRMENEVALQQAEMRMVRWCVVSSYKIEFQVKV